MKRFKVEYTINGKEVELYAEPMDMNHRMYSLERHLVDPDPLLIERTDAGWRVCSQDNWGLSDTEINNLGDMLEREYEHRPQE